MIALQQKAEAKLKTTLKDDYLTKCRLPQSWTAAACQIGTRQPVCYKPLIATSGAGIKGIWAIWINSITVLSFLLLIEANRFEWCVCWLSAFCSQLYPPKLWITIMHKGFIRKSLCRHQEWVYHIDRIKVLSGGIKDGGESECCSVMGRTEGR